MGVVHIGHVRMFVPHRFMPMAMSVALSRWITGLVRVLVMFIVHVRVDMIHWFMRVFMLMIFSQVQPNSEAHQKSGDD